MGTLGDLLVLGVPCVRVRNQTLFFGAMCVENAKLIPTCRINFLNFPWQLPGPCRPAGGSPASCGACTRVCSVWKSKNKALVFWGSKYRECKKQLQLSALTSRSPHGKVKAQTLIFGVTCAGSVKVQLITYNVVISAVVPRVGGSWDPCEICVRPVQCPCKICVANYLTQ